jgi:palmitoyl transferase
MLTKACRLLLILMLLISNAYSSEDVTDYIKKVFVEGNTDLYLSGYAWHNRFTYSKETIATHNYNELAWGGGLGRGYKDSDGDWQAFYALGFLDSHKYFEPVAGYAFLKKFRIQDNFNFGLGFSILLTQRPDILNGYPFLGAVPLINLEYKRAALFAAYVPGLGQNVGNVLFLFLKIALNI